MTAGAKNGGGRGECPVCGGETCRALFNAGGVSVLVCGRCETGFVSPMPDGEDLKNIYGCDYFGGGSKETGYADYDAEAGLGGEWTRYFWEERLNDVEKYAGGRRGGLLEIGCAYGVFLELARGRGWRVDGVEISAHAAEVAGKRLGIKIFNGTLEEAPIPKDSFDAVAAFEVIEHVPDPKAFVRRVNELLKPGGVFALTTPNDLFSLRARLTKDKKQLVKLPEHVVFYSTKSISRLLADGGFSVAAIYNFEAKSLRRGKDIVEKQLGGLYRAVRPAIRPAWRFMLNRFGLGEAIFCVGVKNP